MHHIIYLSWATTPFTTAQLQGLLTGARRRNTELAVTGILLYGNECFVQVLEGEADVVQELWPWLKVWSKSRIWKASCSARVGPPLVTPF